MKKCSFGEDQQVLYRLMEGEVIPGYDPREQVMHEIQNFIASSYFLGINPLEGLRKTFPQYQWVHNRVPNRRYVNRIISCSDFVWLVAGFLPSTEEILELVTATELGRGEHFALLFAGKDSDPDSKGGRIATFAKSVRGKPVFW